jgi:hypothetical protein
VAFAAAVLVGCGTRQSTKHPDSTGAAPGPHYQGAVTHKEIIDFATLRPPVPGDKGVADWRVIYSDWFRSSDHYCRGGCIGQAPTGIVLARVSIVIDASPGISNELMYVLTTKHMRCINGPIDRAAHTYLPTYRCTMTEFFDARTGRAVWSEWAGETAG